MNLRMCSCSQCKLGRKSKCESAMILRKKKSHRHKVKSILSKVSQDNLDLLDGIDNQVPIPYNG